MRNKLLKTVAFLWLLVLWQPANAQQWEPAHQLTNPYPNSLTPYFHCADTGWMINYRQVFYTTDRGNTLQKVFQYPDSLITDNYDQPYRIYPINGKVAYMLIAPFTSYQRLFKTTNGGYNWIEWTAIPAVNRPGHIVFVDEFNVVAFFYNHPKKFSYSTNGGKTWTTSLELGYDDIQLLEYNPADNSLWAFNTGTSNIYCSVDSGRTWQLKNNPININNGILKLSFFDCHKAAVYLYEEGSGSINRVLITHDAFNSIAYSHTIDSVRDICYQKEDAIWVMSVYKILKSTNGGESFEVFQSTEKRLFYWNLHFKQNVGYVGIWPAILLRYVDTISSINWPAFEKPTALNVWPNPAANNIYIESDFFKDKQIILRIFSITGEVLMNKELWEISANNETIVFSTNDFPNGVYILTTTGIESNFSTKFIINR